MAEIAAGVFPPGVVQALSGDDNLGPWMTKHPGIAKISFTGSIPTGKKIMAAAAETLKRVNLEMYDEPWNVVSQKGNMLTRGTNRGGNDAAVITEDFDMERAAMLNLAATMPHAGQICIATKRIYVHESRYDEFMEHFTRLVRELTPGNGYCSPIQNRMQYDKVRDLYADCARNGYTFAVGSGDVPAAPAPGEGGFFIAPAVIAKPPDNSRVVVEEQFGPIVPVLTFRNDDDVVARLNDSHMGLGGAVYCRDKKRAWDMASRMEAGLVWVNGGVKIHPEGLLIPFKQSGIGGVLGPLALKEYTNLRTVTHWKSLTGGVGLLG